MKENRSDWTVHLQLGFELSLYVIVFLALGFWADLRFDTRPVLTLSGAFLAILSVFYIIWKRFLRNKQ